MDPQLIDTPIHNNWLKKKIVPQKIAISKIELLKLLENISKQQAQFQNTTENELDFSTFESSIKEVNKEDRSFQKDQELQKNINLEDKLFLENFEKNWQKFSLSKRNSLEFAEQN